MVTRLGAKAREANIYPSYEKILLAKNNCYPKLESIEVSETAAQVKLQSLLDHTTIRIFDVQGSFILKYSHFLC